MIIYSEYKDTFLDEVRHNTIHSKIHLEFQRRLHRRVGQSEIDSWRNSLQYMSSVLQVGDIPADARVAIEFTIPLTGKRIDFILTGQDEDQNDVAVIVELKQWSQVEVTDKDAIVRTRLGGHLVETSHPSYQSWTYAALLEDYNETVQTDSIGIRPCAYLHNLDSGSAIQDARYREHLNKAPSFVGADASKLARFLSRYVKHGDTANVMYRIEHGRIRPSKALADHLASMLEGNCEFLMLDEQKLVFESAIDLAHAAQTGPRQVLIVEGGPGTGKSVVAINLLVELTRRDLVAQYVSRNAAPRAVYAAKLAGTLRKTRINNLFKGSGTFLDAELRQIDALIIDEAHRLNEKSGLFSNLGEHQIKELIAASKLAIFFIDEDQRVTWKDVGTTDDILRFASEAGARVTQLKLEAQFRCSGSDGYIAFLDHALQIRETANDTISADEFDFRVFDDVKDMHDAIRAKNAEHNKARMVAGYCWDWASKKDPSALDIVLDEGRYAAQWNLTQDGSLWIIAPESVEQVGCIHTCQGLEVDYVGVIIGPDFIIRDDEAHTDAAERSSMDASVKGYKTMLKSSPAEARERADRIIKNTYRTLMSRGQRGCFIYCTDPETNAYFKSLIAEPDSATDPRAATAQVSAYPGLGLRLMETDEVRPFENALPIYDLKIAAGGFSEGQTPPAEDWVEAPSHIRATSDMFITRVVGESMNKRIPNGAWCLFRANPGGTRNGKIVLVSHRRISDADTGEHYTIKRYFSEKTVDDNGHFVQSSIVLKPESWDPAYEPIVLQADEDAERAVVAEFIQVIE